MTPINLAEKLSTVSASWSPRMSGSCSGHDPIGVKGQGEFIWHSHFDTDDFFLGPAGEQTTDPEGDAASLKPAEPFLVPKAVRHGPRAAIETHLLVIEPAGTPRTGDPATAANKVHI
jgi:mannose-6-phosphate isomerase-like protein (cupin superfamily)